MGTLIYSGTKFTLDDRVLAHIQLVVGVKLRRSEQFFVSWRNTPQTGGGRQSVWIDNGVPLVFEYEGGSVPTVNREWIDTLAASAGSNYGLQITDENGQLLNVPKHVPVA